MTAPHYVTTGRGQIRIYFTDGTGGPTLVVLGGAARAASCVAAELTLVLPGRRMVVVEPPGIGGSARALPGSIEDRAATIAEALAFLDGEPIDLAALDLSASLVPALVAGLTIRRTVLVDTESARGWVDHGTSPPSPQPRSDGGHLTAFWSFLRDRRLLRADAPTLPRTCGAALPDVADLAASFVAAITRPEAFVAHWLAAAAALPAAIDELTASGPHADCIAVLADLPKVLDPPETRPSKQPVPPTTPPSQRDEPWHQYVETAIGRVHLRRAGSTGHPVLVLPTGGGSSAQFEPVMCGLAQTRTVAALDYPGNGLSERLARVPDIAGLAREALAVADALGWETFDLWGSHTGACVALEMIVQFPDRIGRGVLEGPVMVSDEFRDDLLARYFPDLAPDAFGTHLPRAWNWRRDVFCYWPWYRVEHAAARTIGVPNAEDLQLYAVGILESGATYSGAYRAAFDYDTRARLPQLNRPIIITAGPHDMLANALDDAADLAPDGLLKVVPTPETVWWPDPDPVAAEKTMQIYREFLG